jgi:hypothetical protein
MNETDGQSAGRAPTANWYPDPSAQHEFRYWDGAAWTHDVADRGQTSVDPITAPPHGAVGGQSVGTAGPETVLMTLPRVSDVAWGGSMNVYLTSRRLIVEPVLGTGATIGAVAAGGLAGARIARHAAEKRLSREVNGQARTLDEILASSNKAYAIDYSEVTEIVLKKKALPIGHSRCKIQSRQKDTTLAFKREMFDEASAVLAEVLPGRVTIR